MFTTSSFIKGPRTRYINIYQHLNLGLSRGTEKRANAGSPWIGWLCPWRTLDRSCKVSRLDNLMSFLESIVRNAWYMMFSLDLYNTLIDTWYILYYMHDYNVCGYLYTKGMVYTVHLHTSQNAFNVSSIYRTHKSSWTKLQSAILSDILQSNMSQPMLEFASRWYSSWIMLQMYEKQMQEVL